MIRPPFSLNLQALMLAFAGVMMTLCLQAQTEDYPIHMDKDTLHNYSKRYITGVSFKSGEVKTEVLTGASAYNLKVYTLCDELPLVALKGEGVTPHIHFTDHWMHGYVFVDWNRNGQFDNLNIQADGTPAEGSELVSYTYYKNDSVECNSLGEPVREQAASALFQDMPAFRIPEGVTAGNYRIRFKVDWDSTDPAGCMDEGNDLITNGGGFVDAILTVCEGMSHVTVVSDGHGEILNDEGFSVDGTNLPVATPCPLTLKVDAGYTLKGLIVQSGSEQEPIHGVKQSFTSLIAAYQIKDNRWTLPASMIAGEVTLKPYFTTTVADGDYPVNFDSDTACSQRPTVSNRPDQYLSNVKFTTESVSKAFSFSSATPFKLYWNRMFGESNGNGSTYTTMPIVRAGDEVHTLLTYTRNTESPLPVHAYLYVDFNNDGQFTVDLDENGLPTAFSELVAFSYLNGQNSEGYALDAKDDALHMPTFRVPEELPSGLYRMRVKVDTDNADPAGYYDTTSVSDIAHVGGLILDATLDVYNGPATLTLETMHGNIYASNNAALPVELTPGVTSFTMVPKPFSDGYVLKDGWTVRRGYNLNGPERVHGNLQWVENTLKTKSKVYSSSAVIGDMKATALYSNESSEWEMAFDDEFNAANGTPYDDSKWVCSQPNGSAWARFITDDKSLALQKDGHLELTCVPTGVGTMKSGAIETRNKFFFTAGKVECRARSYAHTGNFPAIWMMPQDTKEGWPGCGEIDIFETINSDQRAWHTVHSHWTYNLGKTWNPQSSFNEAQDLSTYHTYGMEKEDGLIRWFVDGVQVASYARSSNESDIEQGQWPFERDFYLILNQSVGNGSWASGPDLTHTYRFDVDWIRVYKKGATSIESLTETPEETLFVKAVEGGLMVTAPHPTTLTVNDLGGRVISRHQISGNHLIPLPRGIYLVRGRKYIF